MGRGLTCPSAQPDQPGAGVIGVVGRSASGPRVTLLRAAAPLEAITPLIPDEVPVTEVVRLAAPCAEDRCRHYQGARCTLADRIAVALEPVVDRPAPCAIRVSCRWWAQTGPSACRRCPQIVTEPFAADERLRTVAAPPPRLPQFSQRTKGP